MIRARLTLEPDGAVCLESDYERVFVEGLKQALPFSARSWHPDRKRWVISALYADDLVRYLTQVGVQLQDDRSQEGGSVVTAPPPMPPDLRDAFDTLYLAHNAPLYVAEQVYKSLSKLFHPDAGGQPEHFHAINDAIHIIRRYLVPKPVDEHDDDDIPF